MKRKLSQSIIGAVLHQRSYKSIRDICNIIRLPLLCHRLDGEPDLVPLTHKHAPLKLACLSLAFLATSCATTEPTPPRAAATITAPLTLTYTKGQLISLIIIDAKDGEAATAARDNYYATAFPMATSFGLKRDAGLTIAMTMVGKFKPEALGIFSWPSLAASDELSAQSGWPTIKATRPDGWDELAIFTAPIDRKSVV